MINQTPLREFEKSIDDDLDYGFLFSDWLFDGDAIVSSVWTVPTPLTKRNEAVNLTPITRCGRVHPANTATSVFIAGGELDEDYIIVNKITTTQGRVVVRRFRLWVINAGS